MIYANWLGDLYLQLHPQLQKRYRLLEGEEFYAEGTMTLVATRPKLFKPLYTLLTWNDLLFPESGTNIPFSLHMCTKRINDCTIDVIWTRTLHFEHTTRRFISTMRINEPTYEATDYLGSPALLASPIEPTVTQDGTFIMSSAKQFAPSPLGLIPLPKLMGGRVIVEEGYNEKREHFTIHVSMHNPIFGTMMQYAGHFVEKKR